MGKWLALTGIAVVVAVFLTWFIYLRGDGGFERMVTMTGIYAVCQPGGYDVVCFVDASSAHSSPSCLPLSAIGGKCK
jgi:hypothetical protein